MFRPGGAARARPARTVGRCEMSTERIMFSTSPVRSPSHRPRILVVEDTFDTRELIKVILEMEGYAVLEAGDGAEAVAMASSELPDAIVMDMSLPFMDGCQATRRIRQNPALRDVPIIACTAHNRWEWRAKAIVAGCDYFVEKPIDFGQLSALLSKRLSGPRGADLGGA